MNLLERIKQLFQPRVIYKIVEVKVPRPIYRWDQNTKDAIATLSSHPGFVALVDRLNLTKAQIESTLKSTMHKDLRQVDFLQSGSFWAGWLQEQIEKATYKGSQTKYLDPMEEELKAFQELDARIERVGMDPVSQTTSL